MNKELRRRVPDSESGADSAPVASPCIGICQMNPQTGLCEGCQRTLDEIAEWGSASDEWKRAVWQRIARRSGFDD